MFLQAEFKRCIHTLVLMSYFMVMTVFASEIADFSTVVEKASPAVVSIVTVDNQNPKKKLVPDELREKLERTPLMDVLKQVFGPELEEKLYGEQSSGLGSGTIISDDGYIITNFHVIDGATKVYVELKDHNEYDAEVIGIDRGTDLALLKINAKNLPTLKFSDTPVKIGQWVLAIGAPYGFDNTATVGVVSGKSRSLGQERYVPFIQTDVAINPGNSGGPLLNLEGEMVGMNSQIVSESGSYAGLSFATPSDVIQNVVAQLKVQGYVNRGWLGLAFQDLDHDLARSFGLSQLKGALVSRVIENSPAQRAGIQVGDIITQFDGKEIRSATDILPLVGLTAIGKQVEIVVLRNHVLNHLTLTVEQSPQDSIKKKAVAVVAPLPEKGITVRELEAGEYRNPESPEVGVIVTNIHAPEWWTAGISVGDVILQVNNTPILSASQFYRIVQELPKNEPTSFLIVENGEVQRFVAVKIMN